MPPQSCTRTRNGCEENDSREVAEAGRQLAQDDLRCRQVRGEEQFEGSAFLLLDEGAADIRGRQEHHEHVLQDEQRDCDRLRLQGQIIARTGNIGKPRSDTEADREADEVHAAQNGRSALARQPNHIVVEKRSEHARCREEITAGPRPG